MTQIQMPLVLDCTVDPKGNPIDRVITQVKTVLLWLYWLDIWTSIPISNIVKSLYRTMCTVILSRQCVEEE